ncbi:response regulator receiver sensor signal transduction histidine kinase [Planoprotostelium fungivorum]|uniref:Response regulator receiver sensor signal transduction histidine kinase n=1 Tax=Planoprotostelium fungivorum TaxID=1890364 RepID=A0A2P6MR01_9EUKA|nr:response regulator receiver sensor signal transduction histidine kinase [Planoprotostelium fungivorum]
MKRRRVSTEDADTNETAKQLKDRWMQKEGKRHFEIENTAKYADGCSWWQRQPEPMGTLLRETDWSKTSIGPIEKWPPMFRTVLELLFANPFPTFLYLGRDLLFFYNDKFPYMFPERHPSAWGQPISEVWKEVWAGTMEPDIRKVIETGQGNFSRDELFLINRITHMQEQYFTFSYSPVTQNNDIIGLTVNIFETSDRVYQDRQNSIIRSLSTPEVVVSKEKAYEYLRKTLHQLEDIPCFGLYLLNEGAVELKSHSFQLHAGIFPRNFSVSGNHAEKNASIDGSDYELDNPPKSRAFGQQMKESILQCLQQRKQIMFSCEDFETPKFGKWDKPVKKWLVYPIHSSSKEQHIFVIGINQFRPYNGTYPSFIEGVANLINVLCTSAKQFEEQQKRKQQLQELSSQRNSFCTRASHQFKTPLTLVLGPLEQFLQTNELNERQKQDIEVFHGNALRLLHLVNHHLEMTREDEKKKAPSMERIELEAQLTPIVLLFAPACKSRGDDVYFDTEMFDEIVSSLLSKSFANTERGSITVRLCRDDKNDIQLIITDTGRGIPTTELTQLTSRAHRSKDTKKIGLSLAQHLAELQLATLHVASTEGVGTTFTLVIRSGRRHIPSHLLKDEESNISPNVITSMLLGRQFAHKMIARAMRWKPPRSNSPTPDAMERRASMDIDMERRASNEISWNSSDEGHKTKICLIASDPSIRSLLVEVIQREYDLEVYNSAEEMSFKTCHPPPHVILVDVTRHTEEGYRILNEGRKWEGLCTIPVVFISARLRSCAAEYLDKGVTDCLVMPFTDIELLMRLAFHISLCDIQINTQLRERKMKEQAILTANAKDAFVAQLAHELRTPLAPALMLLEDIEEDAAVKEVSESIGQLHRCVQSQVFLVDNLLDLVKIGKGKLVLQKECVDLIPLIHGVIEQAKEEGGTNCPPIRINRLSDHTHPYIQGDPIRLKQIFYNILRNSVKFGRNGEFIDVNIRVKERDIVDIEVVDQGIGIEKSRLPTLFNLTHDTLTSEDRYKRTGLGMGLHLCKVLVEGHGGHVTCFSEGADRGTTIRISLPIDRISQQNFLLAVKKRSDSLPKSFRVNVRILLVEDNESIQMVMNRVLAKMSHKVISALTVASAISMGLDNDFDLLICDIGLPDGTGYEVIRKLRAEKKSTFKAIALSGYSLPEDVQASIDSGFDVHMTKPTSDFGSMRAYFWELFLNWFSTIDAVVGLFLYACVTLIFSAIALVYWPIHTLTTKIVAPLLRHWQGKKSDVFGIPTQSLGPLDDIFQRIIDRYTSTAEVDELFSELQRPPAQKRFLLVMSTLAYQRRRKVNQTLDVLEKVMNATISVQRTATFGAHILIVRIVRNNSKPGDRPIIVVAFKGTSPLDATEWFKDFSLRKTAAPYGVLPGLVHSGFFFSLGWPQLHQEVGTDKWTILNQKIDEMVPETKNSDKAAHLWITGHSLGGATSCLFNSILTWRSHNGWAESNPAYDPKWSDRVGDSGFKQVLNDLFDKMNILHIRVSNNLDVVPHVPPGDRDLLQWGRYATQILARFTEKSTKKQGESYGMNCEPYNHLGMSIVDFEHIGTVVHLQKRDRSGWVNIATETPSKDDQNKLMHLMSFLLVWDHAPKEYLLDLDHCSQRLEKDIVNGGDEEQKKMRFRSKMIITTFHHAVRPFSPN